MTAEQPAPEPITEVIGDMTDGLSPTELLDHELGRLANPARIGLPRAAAHALTRAVEPDWRDSAACAGADPEAWFPATQGAYPNRRVTAVCRDCPVRRSCLATALMWSVDGIWAGTTSRERQGLAGRVGSSAAESVDELLDQALDQHRHRARRQAPDWYHRPAPTTQPTPTPPTPSTRPRPGEAA
jgi:hypothetical protein